MNRRRFLATAAATAFLGPHATVHAGIAFFEPSSVQDFDELWRTLAERYCYFGQKATGCR